MRMLLLASDLLKMPVASLDTNSRVGLVKGLLIDTDRSLVVGLLISLGFLSKPKYLDLPEIYSIDRQSIVIRSVQTLTETDEVVRVKKILQEGIKVIGHRVQTEAGRRLGRVSDLLIDSQTGQVTKYYLHHFLVDRIIPTDKIIKITKQAVIVEDEAPRQAEPSASQTPASKPVAAPA